MQPAFGLSRWREAADARRCASGCRTAVHLGVLLLVVFGGSFGAQVVTPALEVREDADVGRALLASLLLTLLSAVNAASLLVAARRSGAHRAEARLQNAMLALVYDSERAPAWLHDAVPFMEAHFR